MMTDPFDHTIRANKKGHIISRLIEEKTGDTRLVLVFNEGDQLVLDDQENDTMLRIVFEDGDQLVIEARGSHCDDVWLDTRWEDAQ